MAHRVAAVHPLKEHRLPNREVHAVHVPREIDLLMEDTARERHIAGAAAPVESNTAVVCRITAGEIVPEGAADERSILQVGAAVKRGGVGVSASARVERAAVGVIVQERVSLIGAGVKPGGTRIVAVVQARIRVVGAAGKYCPAVVGAL